MYFSIIYYQTLHKILGNRELACSNGSVIVVLI